MSSARYTQLPWAGQERSRRSWKFYVCSGLASLIALALVLNGLRFLTSPQHAVQSASMPTPTTDGSNGSEVPVAEPSSGMLPAADPMVPPNEEGNEGKEEEEEEEEEVVPGYQQDKLFFEFELPYDVPNMDIASLRAKAPHNYKGQGHETFALVFLSRNASLQDPYFLATHEVVYRLLWNPETKSKKYPVTIFVPPFVAEEQRATFEAVGAIVREVEESTWEPEAGSLLAHRLRDVFTKLEMWRQTDFTRIAYVDSDAFPLTNVDALLEQEMIPNQRCKEELLTAQEEIHEWEICEYIFAGVHDYWLNMVNAGMMILKPNRALYDIIIRESRNTSNFDNGFAEQALLGYVFKEDGPFPPTYLTDAWNGGPDVRDQGRPLYIVHAKLWALFFDPKHWASSIFGDTWGNLTLFYESEEFLQARNHDDALLRAIIEEDTPKAHHDG